MAQETKLKRKDLKKPDQFLETSNEFLIFLDRYKTILLSVLVGLFLAWGGIPVSVQPAKSGRPGNGIALFSNDPKSEGEQEPIR